MSGYLDSCEVEKRGMKEIISYLSRRYPLWHIAKTYEATERGKALQTQFGDLFIFRDDKHILQIAEVKIEQSERHRNLFLETWSNFLLNPGWMMKGKFTDLLFYYFIDSGNLYVLEMPALREWFYNGGLRRFEEKKQQAYDQKNETRGIVVPIDIIRREVGMREYNTKATEQ